jgi:hypothetical protein
MHENINKKSVITSITNWEESFKVYITSYVNSIWAVGYIGHVVPSAVHTHILEIL